MEPGNEQATITGEDPFALFDDWFAQACQHEPGDPEAVALATASPAGAPSLRMVLMKEHGKHLGVPGGFVFYTNSHSRKGAELLANPQAALLFHWKSLRRQVRIEGLANPVSDSMADAYFASRPRDSQIGAHASLQSEPLPSRTVFLGRIAAETARHGLGKVPRPQHWTGFCLVPHTIEFWQDRLFRLHERRQFTLGKEGGWTSTLLYP